ncbi:zinc transporter 6-like [Babylonia areolata]|uniref:zinc transporter 6-like n=1 Tax=Babylonia areolata TaxID=304850 RepID=UPI003FD06556
MASAPYSKMPDLISSSVSLDVPNNIPPSPGTKYHTSGTIYPFPSSKRSLLGTLVRELSSVAQLREAKKILGFLILNIIATFMLLLWCHTTNSMALTAFAYLTIFDAMSLLTCLLSLWVQTQRPSASYSFGYERFEVLAVFASTMLAQLGSLFIMKESVECIIQQPEIHTGRLLVGTMFGLTVHLVLTFLVKNRAMNHVVDASTSSWLQEHMADMSESLCSFIPGLSKLLLPRINPMLLIGIGSSVALFISYILIDTQAYHTADTWAAISIAVMTCGTMFPMSVYTGKILLQTTPSHILSQLDKLLREASTLDGVLEFRHEHFWTLSFGTLAGSVQVRVRRDADEQLVLAHVFNRLSNLVNVLTVQIFKDDWTRGSAFAVLGSSPFGPMPGTGAGRAQSPTQDYSASYLPVSSFRPLPIAPSPPSSVMGGVPVPSRVPVDSTTGVGRLGGSATVRSTSSSASQFSAVDLS